MNNFLSLVKRQPKAMVAHVVDSQCMLLNKCTPRMAHGTSGAFHVRNATDLL